MSAELKPCPFCGSPAEIKGKKTVMVSCTGCTATTFQEQADKGSAIAAWNRRIADAMLAERSK
jgi:Lar family restriction alleviation protein